MPPAHRPAAPATRWRAAEPKTKAHSPGRPPPGVGTVCPYRPGFLPEPRALDVYKLHRPQANETTYLRQPYPGPATSRRVLTWGWWLHSTAREPQLFLKYLQVSRLARENNYEYQNAFIQCTYIYLQRLPNPQGLLGEISVSFLKLIFSTPILSV